jgi:hypothetical protein
MTVSALAMMNTFIPVSPYSKALRTALIDESEVWDLAESIPNGSAAAIVLIEHLWAAPLRNAIARAGGVPVSDEWVHPLDLVEVGLIGAAELERA